MSGDTVETSSIPECSTKYPGPYTIVSDDEMACIFEKLMEYTDKWLKFKKLEEDGKHFMVTYTHKFYMRGRFLKGRDWIIPLLDFDKAYECVPYIFYIVTKGVDLIDNRNVDDLARKYFIKVVPEPSAPPALALAQVQAPVLTQVQAQAPIQRPVKTQQVQLPKQNNPYMWKCLMEGALFRKETCPISLEELTIENICILPCMHCLDIGSVGAMRRRQCPVCRKDFAVDGIIRYTN